MIAKKPKNYSDASVKKGQDYFNYDALTLVYGNQEDYEITRKVGRGKYSEAFEGVNMSNGEKCVIKILKPIKKKKVKREVKILQNLAGGPNIVKLFDIVHDVETNTTSLVLEYAHNPLDHRTLYPTFTDFDVRYYMYEICRALDYINSMGIMHRDIKPHNIMIDHEKREVRIIDWGLAEFYLPNTEYNVRVASRYYKAPELLVDYVFYDYAIDVWSLGAMFAGIIFMREPFFQGNDNVDQLEKITRILGTEELLGYLKKYNIDLDSQFDGILGQHTKKPWSKFITPKNQHLAVPEALDLLDRMLVYDHAERITPKEAMNHPYFAPVIEFNKTKKQAEPKKAAGKQ